MKEFELIAMLADTLRQPPAGVVGIGDDCAVVGTGATGVKLLYCVDTLTDTVHFDRTISSPAEIGYKAAAVNISDIAAMGGTPKFLLVSLQLSLSEPADFVSQLYNGLDRCCAEHGVFVVGGDTTSANQFSVTVVAIGEVSGEPLLRSGAKIGDNLFVSGVIGQAWGGLSLARGELNAELLRDADACLQRHKLATARVALGKLLQQGQLATSAIDISDGLLSEATHLADASKLSFELYLDAVPLCVATNEEQSLQISALSGGDDYELLFTSALSELEINQRLGSEVAVTQIGRAIPREKKPVIVYSAMGGKLLDLTGHRAGYEHCS